jgi:tetratricopeptide (TPR) repeat protein
MEPRNDDMTKAEETSRTEPGDENSAADQAQPSAKNAEVANSDENLKLTGNLATDNKESEEDDEDENVSSKLLTILFAIMVLYIIFRMTMCFLSEDNETMNSATQTAKPQECPPPEVKLEFDQWIFDDAFHLNFGLAYSNAGLFDDAELEFRRAIKLNQNSTLAYNNLGWVYVQKGDWRQAVDTYKKALKLDPNMVLAKNNLYDTYMKLIESTSGDQEKAAIKQEAAESLGITIK